MPIPSGAVTYARFRTEEVKPRAKDLRRSFATAVRKRAFEVLDRDGDVDRSAGWVELDNHESTELQPQSFLYGDYLLLTWRVDELRVPAQAMKAELEKWTKKIQADTGRKPSRKDKTNEKELILRKLRKRAFITTRTYDVSWHLQTERLAIWTSARKIIEELEPALEETFGVRLHAQSPGALVELAGIAVDDIMPTPLLFGTDVASEARGHVGA